MARPRTLTEATILEAAAQLVRDHGADRLTIRALGERLAVDPTSVYRYFATMNELRRALGDHFLAEVDVDLADDASWRESVRSICIELRRAQLRQPGLAALVRSAPTRLANELRISEALLAQLLRAGLGDADAASAYHALIELSVGSAAIDVELDGTPPATRDAVYRQWREHYAALDPSAFPAAVQVAASLYAGSADQRFEQALDWLLDGVALRVPTPR